MTKKVRYDGKGMPPLMVNFLIILIGLGGTMLAPFINHAGEAVFAFLPAGGGATIFIVYNLGNWYIRTHGSGDDS